MTTIARSAARAKTLKPKNGLEKVITIVGSAAALAEAIGCTEQAVSLWRRRGKPPAGRCLQVSRVVRGVVTCHELDPKVFPRFEPPLVPHTPPDDATPTGDRFAPPGFHDPDGDAPWFDIGGAS